MFSFILKIIIFSLFVVFSLFAINDYTDNKVVAKYNDFKMGIQKKFHGCDQKLYVDDGNGSLLISNLNIKNGFSKCLTQKGKEIESLYFEDNSWGKVEEARLIGQYIEKNKIPVIVSGTCDFSCMNAFMYAPIREACEGTEFKLKRMNILNLGSNEVFEKIRSSNERDLMSVYEDSSINISFILEKMKGLKYYMDVELSREELLENKIVDNFIQCDYEKINI